MPPPAERGVSFGPSVVFEYGARDGRGRGVGGAAAGARASPPPSPTSPGAGEQFRRPFGVNRAVPKMRRLRNGMASSGAPSRAFPPPAPPPGAGAVAVDPDWYYYRRRPGPADPWYGAAYRPSEWPWPGWGPPPPPPDPRHRHHHSPPPLGWRAGPAPPAPPPRPQYYRPRWSPPPHGRGGWPSEGRVPPRVPPSPSSVRSAPSGVRSAPERRHSEGGSPLRPKVQAPRTGGGGGGGVAVPSPPPRSRDIRSHDIVTDSGASASPPSPPSPAGFEAADSAGGDDGDPFHPHKFDPLRERSREADEWGGFEGSDGAFSTLGTENRSVRGEAKEAATKARAILRNLQRCVPPIQEGARSRPGGRDGAWDGPPPDFKNVIPTTDPIAFCSGDDPTTVTKGEKERLLPSRPEDAAEELSTLEDMKTALIPIEETPVEELGDDAGDSGINQDDWVKCPPEKPNAADISVDTAPLTEPNTSESSQADESASTDSMMAEHPESSANGYDLRPCVGYLSLALPVDASEGKTSEDGARAATAAAPKSADGGALAELLADLGLDGRAARQRVEETVRRSFLGSRPDRSDAAEPYTSMSVEALKEAATMGTVRTFDEDEEALRDFGPVDVDEERFLSSADVNVDEISCKYSCTSRRCTPKAVSDMPLFVNGIEDFDAALQDVNARALDLISEQKFDDAIDLFRALLQCHSGEYSEKEKPLVASALHNLAILHLAEGEYGAAQRYCRFSIQMRKAFLGPRHLDVVSSLCMMGVIQYAKGKTDKALLSLRKGLGFAQDALGHLNPLAALILNNIGCVYFEMGNAPLALSNFGESLDIQRELLGRSEAEDACTAMLNVSTTLCNVALASVNQGRFELATSLLEEGLTVQQSVLGDDDRRVKSTELLLDIVICAKNKRAAVFGDDFDLNILNDTSNVQITVDEDGWTSFGGTFPESNSI